VQSYSEGLFEQFCRTNAIPCERVATGSGRTPDFEIIVAGVRVTCELKELNPNPEDLRVLAELREGRAASLYPQNRLRGRLKDVSTQLKAACSAGHPTILVVYDNTPFKLYTADGDVIQAMFGRKSITVSVPRDPSLPPPVSAPYLAGNQGVGPTWNTTVSAIAILEGGPQEARGMRLYHNPYAAVRLAPELFEGLPVSQRLLPDATEVSF
jgi:hypothetical protein